MYSGMIIMTGKTVRITDETHMKLTSVMDSYGYKTYGDAVTFCVNQFFLKDEIEDIPKQDKRDIDEINFLRTLALANASNTTNIYVNGGGNYIPPQTNDIEEEPKKLTAEEILELREKVKNGFKGSVKELDAICKETGAISPSMVVEISQPEHKDGEIETIEDYTKRKADEKEGLKTLLDSNSEMLNHVAQESLKETASHPSGLPPPPKEIETNGDT